MMCVPSEETGSRAEAEVKIALRAEEYDRLPTRLQALGFQPAGNSALVDYYVRYAPSASGGWNFLRLRVQDGATYLLTRKEWVRDAQGHAVRLEEEHPVPAAEAQRLLAETPTALKLEKDRREFIGDIQHESATIVLDHLLLGGQPHYFLECEVMTTPERAQQVRDTLFTWMRATLDVQATTEAMSMLELIRAYDQSH
jgi:adenylate cyclase class IV